MVAGTVRRVVMRLLAPLPFVLLVTQVVLAKPQRVVSLNLCTDQLVLLLADPKNIAAVSYLSHDSANSYMAEAARAFPTTHGRVEEILPLQPDLIFAGRFTSQGSVAFLRKMGFRVVTLDSPENFQGIRAQVRQVAALLEEEARGEVFLSEMDRRLERARQTAPDDRLTAAFYLPNGYTAGRNTPVDAVLKFAGFRNKVAELGVKGTVVLSMERLIASSPDILILSSFGDAGASIAEEMLSHPVFARSMNGKTLVRAPTRLWVCPGPMLAEAVELLMESRP
ncbi:MAG: cobalamin ABC transporter substrate-binding protein [Alphaproteobacteria bacterium]|nr:cobalamin ABC transporter substrate-binding protein [Alphaproteobacteria bacterium]|tara:strand:+ start:6087 stop:6929 length:843 start_codon:yes stop_codon:yes gene_type:complete